jgi:hypothetical protein
VGGVVHKSGKYRVERSRAPKRPSRDQRALDRRHDDFGEFSRGRAAHPEKGELGVLPAMRERGAGRLVFVSNETYAPLYEALETEPFLLAEINW